MNYGIKEIKRKHWKGRYKVQIKLKFILNSYLLTSGRTHFISMRQYDGVRFIQEFGLMFV